VWLGLDVARPERQSFECNPDHLASVTSYLYLGRMQPVVSSSRCPQIASRPQMSLSHYTSIRVQALPAVRTVHTRVAKAASIQVERADRSLQVLSQITCQFGHATSPAVLATSAQLAVPSCAEPSSQGMPGNPLPPATHASAPACLPCCSSTPLARCRTWACSDPPWSPCDLACTLLACAAPTGTTTMLTCAFKHAS
jgi:hypothetical protein